MQFKCEKKLYVVELATLVDEKPQSNRNSVISLSVTLGEAQRP